MKNILLPLAFSFLFAVVTQAQWTIGPRVAIGNVSQADAEIRIFPSGDKVPRKIMFHGGGSVNSLGLMAYNKIGPAFLQVEALATQYKLQFEARNAFASDASPQELNETNYIIELPVSAGINYKNFKLGTGPVFEVNLSKSSELETQEGYKDLSKSINSGFQFLLGYQIGKAHIDVRYLNRFTSISDEFGLGDDILKLNKSANRLTLALGVAF